MSFKNTENYTPYYQQIPVIEHIFGVSSTVIDRWIEQGKIVENIHFVKVGTKTRLFNVELLRDRIANWHDDTAHQRGIHAYLSALPSNQPLVRKKAG